MQLHTRDFGEIEIDEKKLITFVSPIYGFDSYQKFALLYQKSISEHFIWLQSVEEPELCFILADPGLVMERYAPKLSEEAVQMLGDGRYFYWLMTSIRDPFDQSTVNLKSPIVVNPQRNLAAQLILEEDFPLRHPLFRKEEK